MTWSNSGWLSDSGWYKNAVVSGNLLTSPNFTSGWSTFQSTLTPNAATDPLGGSTAATEVEDSTTNFHYVFQTNTKDATSHSYTFSVYASGSARNLALQLDDGVANGTGQGFDTTTHVPTASSPFGSGWTVTAQSVTAATGGFWIYSVTITSGLQTTLRALVELDGNSYLGNGTSGLTIWGASLTG